MSADTKSHIYTEVIDSPVSDVGIAAFVIDSFKAAFKEEGNWFRASKKC